MQTSPSVCKHFNYESVNDIIGTEIGEKFFKNPVQRSEFIEIISRNGSIANYEVDFLNKDGEAVNCEVNAVIWYDKNGKPAGVESIVRNITGRVQLENAQKKLFENLQESFSEINNQKVIIESKNKNILESINYAKRLQNALLPSENVIKQITPESFITFKPKDIVSGDFYYVTQTNHYKVIIAADCTGHGVSGAFMSILGITFLTEIINNSQYKHNIRPSKVLEQLREKVKFTLNKANNLRDGMDVAIVMIEKSSNKLFFSGANISVLIVKNEIDNLLINNEKAIRLKESNETLLEKQMFELKADRQPIGMYAKEKPFSDCELVLDKSDVIYLFSDGFADQIGGKDGRKYMKGKLHNFLFSIYKLPMEKQGELLEQEFERWKGENPQIDDVLVMGVKATFESNKQDKFNRSLWEGKTILLAEDVELNYLVIRNYITASGAKIIWVQNGQECVDKYRENIESINLILMDIGMPIMDGYEATRMIRAINEKVPIIVQTAFATDEKALAFEAGCTDYIRKPISENELISTIEKQFILQK